VSQTRNPFRLNVGFLIGQSVGFSRDFPFEIDEIRLDPDLLLEQLRGTARVTRTAQGLLVQVKMQATLLTECVRCLTSYAQPLCIDFAELYAFNNKSVTDSGLMLPDDAHINLTPLVREYMLLDVPIKPVCSLDCKGLCPVCGENLNEKDCGHRPEDTDPRLAVLRSLLNKDT
jgi:uncharacterized protein